MKVIDGENCVLGRLSSKVAKDLMNGEEVRIVNADKIIVLGSYGAIMAKYKMRRGLRDPAKPIKSPKLPRRPDLFVKRTVRGMLPMKSARGREAHRRILAYIGVPKEFEGKGIKIAENKDVYKKMMTIDKICKELGWTNG